MATKNEKNVSAEKYLALLDRVDALSAENDALKAKAPLVGVRWYGEGGFRVGLSSRINGLTTVVLQGYDTKNVIDLAAWIRVQNTEAVKKGVLVRDDGVIKEMEIPGITAPSDKLKNENAYINDDIVTILSKPIKTLQSHMNKITDHFAAQHFLRVATEVDTEDTKKLLINKTCDKLLTRFRYSLLHHHDLTTACELAEIPYRSLSDVEMILSKN